MTNPPLPFTNDAIINQLRHQATNGPAYVQHGATKALAHIKGLYAQAHYEARLAYDTALRCPALSSLRCPVLDTGPRPRSHLATPPRSSPHPHHAPSDNPNTSSPPTTEHMYLR